MDTLELKLVVKSFSELTTEELYEILKVRVDVFVVEQECAYPEVDGIDYESMHVFYKSNNKIIAYLRVYMKDAESGVAQIGRVLTTKRGIGLGEKVLAAGIEVATKQLKAEKIYIEAQSYAIGFYENAGFKVTSEEFLEDGIPHVQMMI